nr:uncharacterized protein LOC123288849 isoform X4 [Equus asinus]
METGLCVAEEGPERGSSGPAPDGDGGRGRRGGGEVEKRGGGEEGWRAGAPRPRAPHGHKAVGTLPGASFRVCSLLLPLTQSPVIGQGVTVHFLLSPPLMLKNTQPLGHRREDVTH